MDIAAVYIAQKKYPNALREFEAVLKINPEVIDALASMVQLYVLQGDRKTAFSKAEEHLAKTKNQAMVYQLMGQIQIGGKNYPKAIAYLEKAIELNPSLVTPYYLLGTVYSAQQNFDMAIAQQEKILTRNPKAVPSLMMIATLYDRKNQPQKANDYYQKVLDINKSIAPAANNLARNYAQHGGNLDVALGLAQRAREVNSTDPTIADTLGWITYKKGSYLAAISLLKESNEKFKGTNPEVLYHLGMSHWKNGDKVAAKDALSKALATDRPFTGRDEAKKTLDSLKS